MKELQNTMNDIAKWSDETFNAKNPGILHHLKKEIDETIVAVQEYETKQPSQELCEKVYFEYADMFMLLLDSAAHFGMSAASIMDYTQKKTRN